MCFINEIHTSSEFKYKLINNHIIFIKTVFSDDTHVIAKVLKFYAHVTVENRPSYNPQINILSLILFNTPLPPNSMFFRCQMGEVSLGKALSIREMLVEKDF